MKSLQSTPKIPAPFRSWRHFKRIVNSNAWTSSAGRQGFDSKNKNASPKKKKLRWTSFFQINSTTLFYYINFHCTRDWKFLELVCLLLLLFVCCLFVCLLFFQSNIFIIDNMIAIKKSPNPSAPPCTRDSGKYQVRVCDRGLTGLTEFVTRYSAWSRNLGRRNRA